MYFKFYEQNYCANCDWLQFSVLFSDDVPEFICPNGYRFEFLPGNNIFKYRAILWDSVGNRHFTLLWKPYSKLIGANICTVQIDNHVLYNDGIMSTFRLLQSCVACEFNSMGRIDIALDFEVDSRLLEIITQMMSGDVYVARKSEGSQFWHTDKSERGRFVHCMSWGSKTSEIKVKLYNKTRELGIDKDGFATSKQYIVDRWIEAGMNPQQVWRIEFSMQSSGQLRVNKHTITLQDVATSNWLLQMFLNLYANRFVCRRNTGKVGGHHNDDPIVPFLYLPKTTTEIRWAEPAADVKPSSEAITLLRKLVGLLDMQVTICNDSVFNAIANNILVLCEQSGVRAYFKFFYGGEPEKWLQDLFEKTGEGIHEVTPSLKKLYL